MGLGVVSGTEWVT